MSGQIRQLSEALASQIAAGEVVQRPASVVKELLENAVDAGATRIELHVRGAGKTSIQVVDNGKGMNAEDAVLCFSRHATSKITRSEDLFAIHTLGFRGEALAAIAAVSKVELRTKEAQAELGTQVRIEGSAFKENEPVAAPQGTRFTIRDLFYNVPARRNFLKSDPVELRHLTEELDRMALSYPEVEFFFSASDAETQHYPTATLSQRIVHVLGKASQRHVLPCDERTDYLEVTGYVGTPEAARKTRGEQFLFVNGRFVRHHYLHHALQQAYEGLIPDENHPFYVLFLQVDPKHVDVNVHPTKTEVKFDDERTVYGTVLAAARKALGAHLLVPQIDFAQDINDNLFAPQPDRQAAPQPRRATFGSSMNQDAVSPRTWSPPSDESYYQPDIRPLPQPEQLTLSSSLNESAENDKPQTQGFFQVLGKYVAAPVRSGLLLIDQRAAQQRILYERFLTRLGHSEGASQAYLFPQRIELGAADRALLDEISVDLQRLGFALESEGERTIVLTGVPVDCEDEDGQVLLERLLEQLKNERAELKTDRRETLARALALRAVDTQSHHLTTEQMEGLVDGLFACQTPGFSPSGQRTFRVLDGVDLQTLLHP